MHLHDRAEGSGLPVILLHGLFGSGDNLGALVRPLVAEYRVHSLDLRNHGRSPHAPEMDYTSMAADVRDTMDDLHIDQAIVVGHSMGGKVAMELSINEPERVTHLIVLDIAPISHDQTHDSKLEAMRRLDLTTIANRRDADQALAPDIPDTTVRQFLLKNLTRTDNGFAWRIPLDTIADQYEQISAAPSEGRFDGPTLFVAGGDSSYLTADHADLIEQGFPRARIETIAGVGHWVHNEAPDRTAELIQQFLDES